MAFNDGDAWQEQRRFTLRHLRDFGFGKTSSENSIQEEINDLMKEIKVQAQISNGLVDFRGMFNLSLLNVIWTVVSGERFKLHDAKLKKLFATVNTIIRRGNPFRAGIPIPKIILSNFPFLRRLLGAPPVELLTQLQDFIRVNKFIIKTNFRFLWNFHRLLQKSIEKHEADRSYDSPRDFIDVYLAEMDKSNNGNSSFHSIEIFLILKTFFFLLKAINIFFFILENQLIVTVMDLFFGGTESTSNSIGFKF